MSQSRRECIESISIEENCDGSDTCTLLIADPDFEFIADTVLVEHAAIKIELGWEGETYRSTFYGYISAVDINFPDTGYPSMSLFCLDTSQIMDRKKKDRTWDNVSSADVIRKIAKEYGFKTLIQSSYTFKKEETISQSGSTDIEFCESLAGNEREPFMCKLIGNTLYYLKKAQLGASVCTLSYKKAPYDVRNFKPQINKETRKKKA